MMAAMSLVDEKKAFFESLLATAAPEVKADPKRHPEKGGLSTYTLSGRRNSHPPPDFAYVMSMVEQQLAAVASQKRKPTDLVPPQKPKRTFAHDAYMSLKVTHRSSAAASTEATFSNVRPLILKPNKVNPVRPLKQNGSPAPPPPLPPKPANLCRPPPETTSYAVSQELSDGFCRLPFEFDDPSTSPARTQRSHSEEVYATPRLLQKKASLEPQPTPRASLCYAVTDIVRMRHPAQRRNSRAEIRSFVENPVSPISDRPSTTSSDEMVDSVEPSLEPRTSRLRRSDAFKRPRTRPKSLAPPPPPPPRERNTPKSEDCEEEAEVDGEEEVVEEGEEAGSSSRSSVVARRGAEARIARLKTRVQRARLVRRATLDLYNKQITDFCARRTLFQEALVVRLVSRDDTHDDESTSSSLSEFIPAIDFVYPEEPNGTSSADLVRFFYPDYTRARKYGEYSHWKGNEEFVVGLTNEHAERRYAYCLRYLPEHKMGSLVASEDGDDAASEEDKWVTPEVLVIISPINNASFYLDLARHCVTYLQRGGHRRLHEFLSAVYCKEYPRNNGTLNVRERSSSSSLVTIRNRGAPLGRTGLAQQLHKLGPEVAMCCVAALLAEERVLVTGSSVSDVTRMVHALSALIRPLVWPYVFVPVIPDDIPSLCYNPTPYLMGILRPNLSPIRDMLTDDNDDDKHFMLVDIDLGIISPLPSRMGRASDKSWVQASAVEYAENVGMPRRYSASLLKALRGALGAGTGPEADDKVETAMLRWYASLFGHFNSAVGQANWDAEAKKRLVASCPDSHGRDYLKILVETSLFAEWVQARQSATASEYDGGDGTTRLNCFIDEHRGHRSLSQIVSKIRLVHKVKQARGSV